ncbi:hypothetical protein NUV30_09215 [Kocuria rhizophila]|uniref:hypothetical protein n=1 Tax=Kocuria rhizophila TaxID=72000 RepID=UPI00214FAED6|nr:hypothetical protein [Kocuria rhizophila]MCR4526548.1 hypothetical protein [Kocuria rhizophila]WSQ04263.1 hypothetical protein OG312_07550 [Kocuria rhizophila]
MIPNTDPALRLIMLNGVPTHAHKIQAWTATGDPLICDETGLCQPSGKWVIVNTRDFLNRPMLAEGLLRDAAARTPR